jgi:hypothetical protein
MPNRAATILALVALGFAASPSLGQVNTETERTAPKAISAAERDALITTIEAAIRSDYVFPEKIAGIVAGLEQALKAGRYDIDDAGLLAQRITQDLGATSDDHHLYLNYDPARYALATQPQATSREDGDAYDRKLSLRDNSGLVELKILPGNIRYLKIARFGWIADETGAAYDAAMRFLSAGDALIIDVRGNPGGDGAAVRYLVSHFLDANVLEFSFLVGTQPPSQSRTLDYLPAGRLKGKPLYVLIDGGVGSAAESFAYDVQQFKLGELVGAKTLGAANNNKFVPIAPGFMLSVSYGRPVHAVSGTNWEGAGVEPSVATAPAQALEIAERLALLRLKEGNGVTADVAADYDWASVGIEAQLHPISLSPDRLRSLAGQYAEIEIQFRDGELSMSRSGRPALGLTPLTVDGLFEVEGTDMLRARFRSDALELLRRGDPAPRIYRRAPG